jgi:hypothetical protein
LIKIGVNEKAAECGAALTRRAHGGKGYAANSQVEIRRWRHDRGVVAAKLEKRSAEARGYPRSDRPAHGRRPRCRDKRNVRVIDECLAGSADPQARRAPILPHD